MVRERMVFLSLAAGLRPRDDLTVSEWADRHRVLTSTESAERGLWRTSRTPYLREIMDALSPQDPCERVVVQAGTQVGKTEIGLNWIGYTVAHDPAPMIIMQPTEHMAERFSKQRLKKLIEASPEVSERIPSARKRDSGNTILLKEFPGGVLILAGANSAAGVRSMPAKRVFADEVSVYPYDVDGEGDVVDLAARRAGTFPDRKIYECSTPTIHDECRIERSYLEGDQRQYWVPCPHCGEFQVLVFKGLVWPTGRPDQAGYVCCKCGVLLQNHEKELMLPAGQWRPTLDDDGRPVGDGKTKSYHLPSFYSPHGLGYTWADIARIWTKTHEDPVTRKTTVNTLFAETWKDTSGDKPEGGPLFARREDYGRPAGPDGLPLVPAEVALLTAAVDMQHDRLELLVVGWGAGRESWHVHHQVIEIDPTNPQAWTELSAAIEAQYPHETLGAIRIRAVCLDTSAYTDEAYKYVTSRLGKRPVVWAIKGQSDVEKRLPIWPAPGSKRTRSRAKLKGAQLVRVGVDTAKEAIYARLKMVRAEDHPRGLPMPGYMHFSLACSEEYFDQLTAEVQKVKLSRGYRLRYWELPSGAANEILDLWGYNLAALDGLTISAGYKLDREARKLPPIPQGPPSAAPAPVAAPSPAKAKKRRPRKREQTYEW